MNYGDTLAEVLNQEFDDSSVDIDLGDFINNHSPSDDELIRLIYRHGRNGISIGWPRSIQMYAEAIPDLFDRPDHLMAATMMERDWLCLHENITSDEAFEKIKQSYPALPGIDVLVDECSIVADEMEKRFALHQPSDRVVLGRSFTLREVSAWVAALIFAVSTVTLHFYTDGVIEKQRDDNAVLAQENKDLAEWRMERAESYARLLVLDQYAIKFNRDGILDEPLKDRRRMGVNVLTALIPEDIDKLETIREVLNNE